MSTLPEYAGAIMLAAGEQSGGAWPTPGHPFYALEAEQLPSYLYREQVLQSGDGQHWSLLPPPPVSGVSSERHGILQVLAVLPDGRLALWGADPQAGMPASNAINQRHQRGDLPFLAVVVGPSREPMADTSAARRISCTGANPCLKKVPAGKMVSVFSSPIGGDTGRSSPPRSAPIQTRARHRAMTGFSQCLRPLIY